MTEAQGAEVIGLLGNVISQQTEILSKQVDLMGVLFVLGGIAIGCAIAYIMAVLLK